MDMIVLCVVSDWSHVLSLDNPVSLRLIVDFDMSNSKIKHPQSENDKIRHVGEIISFFEFEKSSRFEEKRRTSGFHFF